MDVHAAVTSRRTRIGFLLVALLGYGALMAYGAIAGNAAAFEVAKVYIGAVLVIGVGFAAAVRNVRANLLALAAVGYLFAGLAIAYSGLASLGVVPVYPLLAPAGDAAIVIALAAYLYQRHFGGPDHGTTDDAAQTADEATD